MIEKSGLLYVRDNCILLCRKKKGTQLLILPGGKREANESPLECLAREIKEELGALDAIDPVHIGSYTHAAAGKEGKTVHIELFQAELSGDPRAQSEIAELVWFGPSDDRARLAPSIDRKILPDLIARGLLAW